MRNRGRSQLLLQAGQTALHVQYPHVSLPRHNVFSTLRELRAAHLLAQKHGRHCRTGKSTRARTVAHACLDDSNRSASFLVLRSGGERKKTCAFVTTIGVQLTWLPLQPRQ